MTTPHDDDPARAAIRVAEGVVGLVRAELGLAAARARVTGGRLAVTLALSAAAFFLAAVAAVIAVLTPVLWAFRPAAAMASLALAVTFALITSLVALKRWRAQPTNHSEDSIPPVHHDLPGSDHAIPR